MTKVETLLARIEAHENEGTAIEAEMATLDLDAKAVKKIRRAKADADAAKKTLDALMAGGLVPAQDGAVDPAKGAQEPKDGAEAKGK